MFAAASKQDVIKHNVPIKQIIQFPFRSIKKEDPPALAGGSSN